MIATLVVGGTIAVVRNAQGDGRHREGAQIAAEVDRLGPPIVVTTGAGNSYSVRVGQSVLHPETAALGGASVMVPVSVTNLQTD